MNSNILNTPYIHTELYTTVSLSPDQLNNNIYLRNQNTSLPNT